MVDYQPWGGDYTGTIVRNNTIVGGFATQPEDGTEQKGENDEDVIIK